VRRGIRRLLALAAIGFSAAACSGPTPPSAAAANHSVRRGVWEPAPVPRAMEAHQAAYGAPENPRSLILRASHPLPPDHFR
jgi:hypothetical protein